MTGTLVAHGRGRWWLLVASSLVFGAGAIGCATTGTGRGARSDAATPAGAVLRGKATYYADSLAGHKTASGEPYDPGALTAAHRTLPFGTVVRVRRKDGREVTVRINDRGPFGKEDRIVDLSRRAAEELGMIRDGVVTVEVIVVGR